MPIKLIGRRGGERCRGESDPVVGSIEHGVEPLEEGLPVDKIETLAAGAPKIVNNQIEISSNTADVGVEASRPQLGVRSEGKGDAVDDEVQVRQLVELRTRDPQQASIPVRNRPSCRLIFGECVAGQENQGCSGIDNAGGRRENSGRSKCDGLIYPPEFVCGRSFGEWRERDAAGELGGIGATESELAIGYLVGGGGLKRHRHKSGRDFPLSDQVLGHCRNRGACSG